MIQLILSILALLVGVGIYPVIRQRTSLLSFFDAFVLISIPGLTLLHLIPHSVENAGIWGVIAVCLGFGIPGIFHHLHHDHHAHEDHDDHDDHDDAHASHVHKHNWILFGIVAIGVIIHTILDGIGLSMTSNAHGQLLALGVLFHRLPIGIFLGLIMVPMLGFAKTLGIAITFSLTTCIGFVLGHYALPQAGIVFLYVFQGLIAGSLLHIIFHNVSSGGKKHLAIANGLGAFFGIAALVVVEKIAPVHEGHNHGSVLDTWLNYLINAAPVWCIAAIVIGLLMLIAAKAKGRLHHIGETALDFIDPQPTPGSFDNRHHFLSALGLISLLMLFNPAPAIAWWGAALILITAGLLSFRSFRLCDACHEPHICAHHKTLALWTQTSWMCLVLCALLASVIPSFVSPLSEGIESLSPVISWAILALCCIALVTCFVVRRGLRMPGALLLMFLLMAVFYHLDGAFPAIAFTGAAAVWLYDFHPRDIRETIENEVKWHKRYGITAAACGVLMIGACYLVDRCIAHHEPTAVVEIAEHHHHEHEHEHDAEHAHEHEHEHNSEHVHEHASLLAPKTPHQAISLVSLVIFMLVGLMWLLRFGPRELFEIAIGNRHHRHEPEE